VEKYKPFAGYRTGRLNTTCSDKTPPKDTNVASFLKPTHSILPTCLSKN